MTRKYRSVRRNNIKRYKSKMRGGSIEYTQLSNPGKFSGLGTYTYAPNHTYKGSFYNGERNGDGILTRHNEHNEIIDTYNGRWSNNRRNGRGILTKGNEYTYSGMWKDDTRHGYGKETSSCYNEAEQPTGSNKSYEGNFYNNEYSGHGQLINCDKSIYVGEFLSDMFHGNGTYTNKSGIYNGQCEHGRKHGAGNQTFPDNTIYQGRFENNKRHGFGRQTFLNGTVYKGLWENDKKHGKGKLTDDKGKVLYEGEWKDDDQVESAS
jgi:hypothetical protein